MAKKTRAESDELRNKLFQMLYLRREEISFDIPYQEIANVLEIDVRTANQAAQDVVDFFSNIRPNSRGINVGPNSYYQKNLLSEVEIKRELAGCFISQIKQDARVHAIACGNGTTVKECALNLIPLRDLYNVLITTNLGIIEALKGDQIYNLILCGGEFKSEINGCVGWQAVQAFKDTRCEAAVIGISGLNGKGELFVRFAEETEILRQISNSITSHIYIVGSAKKFCQEDTFKFLDINDLLEEKEALKFTIITSSFEDLGSSVMKKKAESVFKELKNIDSRVKVVMAK
jgi:DeoR/GlpR family transcriptional regulator of sugar metabolism